MSRRGGSVELLRLPAALFGAVSGLRGRLYDLGLLPSTRVEVPVVSVGNLTVGGTGKTPFVSFLVRCLRARSLRPGILSRGYKSGGAQANDEARMLDAELGDVPHVQDPDRVRGAQVLVEHGVDVIVLDDGFQHRRLGRDLDLVLVDATRPWGLPREGARDDLRALLPRGLLRERPEKLARADALVLTRSDQVSPDQRAALREELRQFAPGPPVLLAAHRPCALRGPEGLALPTALRDREVSLVSGIGNPDGFEAAVRSLGGVVREHRRFPDHHAYRASDLDGLGGEGVLVVTTAKDAVKLAGLGLAVEPHVLEVQLELLEGQAVLDALLDALPAGAARQRRANLHEGLHG